mgnify:CR=1 FL=1|tara:strand:- start:1402 stop:1671 length:270 start_codon:yes stop_codon:yes gene_type:complete
MARFILFGSYCENAIQKREPFRDEHLQRLSKLKDKGILITLGPTKCNRYVFGIFEALDIEDVKKILKDDIYWSKGIWTKIDVYPWVQAF